MKRLILLLFVLGLMLACGQQEAKVEETPVTEEAMNTVVDSVEAIVDSVAAPVEEAMQ